MRSHLGARVLQVVPTILLVSILVFSLQQIMPGDPAAVLAGEYRGDPAIMAQIRAELWLDRPLPIQYFHWIGGVLHGDLGHSWRINEPVLSLILQKLPVTLQLASMAFAIALCIGVPAGVLAAVYRNTVWDYVVNLVGLAGLSTPNFWLGIMLILLVSVQLGWLPSTGRGTTAALLGVQWSFLTRDGLAHLILPAFNLALFNVSLILRLTRAGVREALPSDYVKFARAKGLTPARIIGVHVMKNILIPIVTVVGLELGTTIAFSVVTETIFAWPGVGKLIIDSINLLDRPVIVAYLMLIVLLFVAINLLVDLLYTALDPRVRLEEQG